MTGVPLRHSWKLTPRQAVALQRDLAPRVDTGARPAPRILIAGADLAFSRDGNSCIGGVVVWHLREKRVVERRVARTKVTFPYVPGLLSFREAPALLASIEKLCCTPDVFIFDGQGLAHPRGFGLACHMGLWLNRPTVGCAKSLLVGVHQPVGPRRGDSTRIIHRDRAIGAVLRTRDNVKPVFVSVGHKISLPGSVRLVLDCGNGFRLPEPTRLADRLVAYEKAAAW